MIIIIVESMYSGSIATRTMMMLLYALLVALVLLSANNNVLAFARSSPRQSISTQTSSSTQQHQRTAVTNDIPFCAEATSIYNNINNSWDVHISRLDKDNNTNDNSNEMTACDVTSPRSWMEHIEQDDQPHGVGAYTVLRCDATYNSKYNKCQWKIWGKGIHMNRLSSSYRMLMNHNKEHTTSAFSDYESKLRTNDIITSLLDEAKTSLLKEDVPSPSKQDEEYVRTLMVTILWTPPKEVVNESTANYKPIIRGHSTFAGKARATTTSNEDLFPSPISVCLGIPSELTSEELAKLPKRYSNDKVCIKSQSLVGANGKISSWCRIRKPLEDSTRFKVPGSNIGEVLLVTQDENKEYQDEEEDFINKLSILEGLTSNLFVIYKDGTIRTAPVGKVLLGYARHLVKEEINEHMQEDLQLDLTAPTIQDAIDGLWSEVFITSSIRLIVPVNRVLIPSIGDDDNEEGHTVLWESNNHSVTRSLWSAIM